MTIRSPEPASTAAEAGGLDIAYGGIEQALTVAGIDLSAYQRAAVLRRIARRMRLLGLTRVDDYAAALARDPIEVRMLVRDIQLPQSLLFRDREVADALQRLLPTLIAGVQRPQVWVPGCGSGEEAWVLAMLLAQTQAAQEAPLDFLVYGSDHEADLLRNTRRGTFIGPERVPEALRHAYLRTQGGVTTVSRSLRERVVFLLHDLISPSPLFGLDIVCCRNLLSSFEPATQRQTLRSLHAALKPEGALLLGHLETLDGYDDLFVADSRMGGLYRRREQTTRLPAPVHPVENVGSLVLGVLPQPAMLIDTRLEIVEANPAALALAAEFARGAVAERFALLDRPRLIEALRGLGAAARTELSLRLASGQSVGVQLARLTGGSGGAAIFLGLTLDGDAEQPLRRDLALMSGRTDALLRVLSNGVVILDASGCVIEFNPVAERLTGWRRAETLGQPYARVFRLSVTGEEPHPVDLALRGQSEDTLRDDLVVQHRDGRRYALKLRIHALPAANGNGGAVLVFEDVSEINLLTEELAYRATHDPLTGLLNRQEFEARSRAALAETKRSGSSAVLCYIDVDQFKIINDTLGHIAGDELLHELAGELRSQLTETDTLARLGGDEFGVLLAGRDLSTARPVVDSLIEAARRFRFFWSGQTYAVTISAGAALIDASSDNVTRSMSMADAACFVAKDAGRDRVRFAAEDDELSRRVVDMSLVGKIGKALDEGRFVLHFEDVVRVDAPEDVVYRELLVRMRDEDGKLLTPGAFIQAAERYFLMSALDRWVLHHALDGIARIPADSVIYAINVSGQSLGDDKFLDYVLSELDRTGVDASRLCFEITETAAVSRLTEAVRFIGRIAETGCRFALDDFGAGMASFSYLKNFRVDFLKIDGSFVRAMLGSRADRGMVESINRIGHEMGLKTIAEHVESTALLEPLREMGVDWAQGRSIAWGRPFEELMR